MITIISGTPGSGKTALIVEMIMEELKTGRKVYTFGIPKLLLNVHEAGNIHQWQDGSWLQIDSYNPELTKEKGIKSTWFPRGCPESCEWLSTCPRVGALNPLYTPDSGALVIIDESHTEFPQRASGKTPPPYVEALTVHRHQGLDFWFVSQRPSFLDPFVRGLSSKHIHLAINVFAFFSGARNKYEWAEYQETVNRTSKLLASKSDYRPSPAVFPLYASSSLHTKLDQRMPTIMRAFIIMVLIVTSLAAFAVYRVYDRTQTLKAQQIANEQSSGLIKTAEASTLPVTASGVPVADSQPPVPVPALPSVKSCIANANKCRCYNAHGQLVPLTESQCRTSVHNITEFFAFDEKPVYRVSAGL